MSVKFGIIYKITNKINGKVYIGQTRTSLKDRFTCHCTAYSTNMPICRAIQKHGRNSFTIEELDTANNIQELNEKEIYYIAKYNATETGYNCLKGGLSYEITEKHRMKLRNGHLWESLAVDQYDLEGNFINSYISIKEAERQTGAKCSHISYCCKNKENYNSVKGYVWVLKGQPFKKKLHKSRTVIQFDRNMNKMQEFPSSVEAGRVMNIHRPSIVKCCRGERPTAGGYIWKFKDGVL